MTTIWPLVDDDTVLQAYATESEALRELTASAQTRAKLNARGC